MVGNNEWSVEYVSGLYRRVDTAYFGCHKLGVTDMLAMFGSSAQCRKHF
jgi:hypothetical protein